MKKLKETESLMAVHTHTHTHTGIFKEKGITLVALVVTIVVLLILAGVSINMVLGENGIVTKAKDARDQTKQAQANELQDFNNISGEIDEILSDNGSGNGGGSGSDTKVPAEPTEETAPYYPDGDFTKKEGTIDTGLVIADKDGNEYVWVVVPKSLFNNTSYNSNNEKKPSSSIDYANIEYCLQQYTATYRNGTTYLDTWADDADNVSWLTSDEYTELKNKMLKSVYENGGFYVGRYEAGIIKNKTGEPGTNSDGKYTIEGMPTPVTKADAYPYKYVTRTQAQNLASNVNSGTKTSSLMFGVQWDLVLAFMSKDTAKITSTEDLTQKSTTIGNYSDSTFQLSQKGKYATFSNGTLDSTWNPSTTSTTNFVDSSRNKIVKSSDGNGILVTTGTSETNKVMNIYDIAGNVDEWTLEWTSSTDDPCVSRGGQFVFTGSFNPAADRSIYSTVSRRLRPRFPCFTFLGKAER